VREALTRLKDTHNDLALQGLNWLEGEQENDKEEVQEWRKVVSCLGDGGLLRRVNPLSGIQYSSLRWLGLWGERS